MEEGASSPADQVRRAFRLTLGREPTDVDLQRMRTYLDSREKSLGNLCQVLLASAEFRYLE